jgi:hypothetical protein
MVNYQFLIEIDALTSANVPETLYFCCLPGFDSGDGKVWRPNIVDPGLINIDLVSGNRTLGPSNYSYGEVVLGNFKSASTVNGPYDNLKDYQYNGRPIRMYYGLTTATYGTSGFTRGYTAIVSGPPVTGWDTFSLTIHGRQAELDIPISTLKFLGNNVAPDGLEGDVELKDKLKPLVLGRPENFSPILCNSSKLIYACSLPTGISANEMGSTLKVFDSGVELFCAGIVTLAYLQANAPPKGQYYVAEEGYIRLGSARVGVITMSGANLGFALTSHPSVLINDILTDAGFNAGDSKDMLDASSLTFGTDKWERGIFLNSETNISKVIDAVVSPLGFWYFNNLGVMRTGLMEDPVGKTPVYTLKSDVNIESFAVAKTEDMKGGVPAKSVALLHRINFTPMTNVAGSVSAERQEWLKNPNTKTVKASTNTVHPLSEELVVNSYITTETTEALDILHDLYTVNREIVTIKVLNNADSSEFRTALAVPPGAIVSVDLLGRFGYSGKPTKLIGMIINWVEESVTMRLWS